MEEESTHAPSKLPEVQEIDPPPQQVVSTKEIPVSSEGMIPINQLKEFIKEMKRPNKAGKTNYPNYYKYHRLYVPRKQNKKADALAALASSLTLPDQAQVVVCQKWVVPLPNKAESEENELKHLVTISKVEKEEWRQPIIDYLCYGILPKNPRRRTKIRRRAPRLLYYKDTLYRRSFDGVLLRCLGEDEALQDL
uniref:Uncharacterized protein n=1 Tax=Nicotiana tabacum TaxID=4097 RepID=A0A1S3YPY6_TOBAC|nr:PREDICTED: uncharacterized protein LOC107778380 [Nicotiana tabacum]